MIRTQFMGALLVILAFSCSDNEVQEQDGGSDAQEDSGSYAGSDGDTDVDADGDVDTDSDTDADDDSDKDGGGTETECLPHYYQECYQDAVYWHDSCGSREDIIKECDGTGQICRNISSFRAECVCRNHWQGENCDICPGNWDPDSDCSECLNGWDPGRDCAVCIPDWEGEDCDVFTGCIRYVNVNGSPDHVDGYSWSTAFTRIQSAINSSCDAIDSYDEIDYCEVWVAQGVYKIWEGDYEDTLQMMPGVELYGGFAGNETLRSQRRYRTNETVLDGYHDDGWDEFNVDNVVTGSDDAVLDGFTITSGNDYYCYTTGMLNDSASPVVSNCLFTGNCGDGGGMANESGSSPVVNNCVFLDNCSDYGGGGMYNRDSSPHISNCIFAKNNLPPFATRGGAIFNQGGSPVIINTIFINNSVEDDYYGAEGGAIQNYDSSPVIINCLFSGNSASSEGGAICNDNSEAKIVNSIFCGNSAEYGGAVAVNDWEGGSPTFINTVFTGNLASELGGAIDNGSIHTRIVNSTFTANKSSGYGGGIYHRKSDTVISSSILWENIPDQIVIDEDAGVSVSFSTVQGGIAGEGNLDTDPLLIGAVYTSGDFSRVEYDESTYQTGLEDKEADWGGDDLSGMFVKPGDGVHKFYIVDNTSKILYVWGDATHITSAGSIYQVYDLHLQEHSPCIDSADGTSAPVFDIENNPRYDKPDAGNTDLCPDSGVKGTWPWDASVPDAGLLDAGSWCVNFVDMGAYEYSAGEK